MKKFNQNTISALIEMFKTCPIVKDSNFTEKDKINVQLLALKKGFVIHPDCINEYSKAFIDAHDMQYNSTFYKTWNDVTDRSRLELFIDQVFHYFTDGSYVDNTNPVIAEWDTYKVIMPRPFCGLYVKCMSMLESGIALKSETVQVLTDFIITYCKDTGFEIVVDNIKNREALVILCDALNVLPKDGAKLFAHILYKTTGATMIIKNRETRRAIEQVSQSNTEKNAKINSIWHNLTDKQLVALSTIFNRYKELFLAYKGHNFLTNRVINKINRLSKKHHKPMKRGFWETVMNIKEFNRLSEVREQAKTATNFKLIQVMQSVRERILLASGMGDNMYIVRNGKVFIKENNYPAVDSRYMMWEYIYNICKEQLVSNLAQKKCKVRLPEKYEIACPTSEKNFVGDLPMGSSCKIDNDSVFGIYWRNDWGTKDFDLSFVDVNGGRIGWNSLYYYDDKNVVYSGDIVNAPNGANEVILIKENCPDGLVYVNRFNGKPNSKFKVFFGVRGDRPIENFTTSHMQDGYCMVNPNDITLETTITQGEMSQTMVGCIFDGKMHFVDLSCGRDRVASAIRNYMRNNKKDMANVYTVSSNGVTEILKRKAYSSIPLKDILVEAGFKVVDKNADIDFTQLDRSTLIELFS